MGSPERKRQLPHVEETDILNMVMEEVIDPSHNEWWDALAQTNNVLARHVLMRAYHASKEVDGNTSLDRQKAILDVVAFALRALTVAGERLSDLAIQSNESELEFSADGVGGEDRQP